MTLGGAVSHAEVTEGVTHQDDAVTMDELLKVVGLMQRVLVLVEHVYQRALETSQYALQSKRSHATRTQLRVSFGDCKKRLTLRPQSSDSTDVTSH